MKFRRITKILLFLLGISILPVLLVSLFGYEISNYYIQKLFRTKTAFSDYNIKQIDLTSGEITVAFRNFLVYNTLNHKDTLFLAEKILVKSNFYNLLFHKVKILNYIYIQNLIANVGKDSLERKNYRIFPPYDPGRNPPPEIRLQKLLITNINFNYQNDYTNQNYKLYLDTLDVMIRIFPHNLFVNLYLTGKTKALYIKQIPFVENRKIDIKTVFYYNKADKMVYLHKGSQFALENIPIYMDGSAGIGALRNYNINIYSPKAKLKTILDLLPQKIRNQLKNYYVGGDLLLNGYYYSTHFSEKPIIKLNYKCDKGYITSKIFNKTINNIYFKGEFSNGKKRSVKTTFFTLDSIHASFENQPIIGNVKIYDLTAPKFQGKIYTKLKVRDLIPFMGVDIDKKNTKGFVIININSKAPVEVLKDRKLIKKLKYLGFIALKDVNIKLKNSNYQLSYINTDFIFKGSEAISEKIFLHINNQPVIIEKFVLDNFIPFLFEDNEKLKVYASVFATKTDLNAIFIRSTKKTKFNPGFLDKIDLNLNINLRTTKIKNLFTEEIKFKFNLSNKKYSIENFLLKYPYTEIHANIAGSFIDSSVIYNASVSLNSEHVAQSVIPFVNTTTKLYREIATIKPIKLKANIFSIGKTNIFNPKQTFASLLIDKGSLSFTNKQISLTDVKLHTIIDPTLFVSNNISINNLSFFIDKKHVVSGKVFIEKFLDKNPKILTKIKGELSADFIVEKTSLKNLISKPSGNIIFFATIKTTLDDIINLRYNNIKTAGKTLIQNLKFNLYNIDFSGINSYITYDKQIIIKYLSGKIDDYGFLAKGKSPAFINFIFNPEKYPLKGNFNLNLDSLNINKLISIATKTQKKQKKTKTLAKAFFNTLLEFNLEIKKLIFKKWRLKNISGKLTTNKNKISIPFLHFNTLGGSAKISVKTEILPNGNFPTLIRFNIANMDIDNLFYNLDEFNQNFITSKNLEGKTFAQGTFFYVFKTDEKKVNFKNVEMHFSFKVLKGKLKQFPLLQVFKLFVKEERLDNPIFNIVGYNFTMHRGTLFIPRLEFHSNIKDIILSGNINVNLEYKFFVSVINASYVKRKRTRENDNKTLSTFIIEGKNKHIIIKYNRKKALRNLILTLKNFQG